jgi:hypothetical protein
MDAVGFIEIFCVNKDKPELKCNGKCHLKKVVQSQDQGQKTPESIINFKELTLFSAPVETLLFQQKEYIKQKNITNYTNLYSFHKTNDCFHPPRV